VFLGPRGGPGHTVVCMNTFLAEFGVADRMVKTLILTLVSTESVAPSSCISFLFRDDGRRLRALRRKERHVAVTLEGQPA